EILAVIEVVEVHAEARRRGGGVARPSGGTDLFLENQAGPCRAHYLGGHGLLSGRASLAKLRPKVVELRAGRRELAILQHYAPCPLRHPGDGGQLNLYLSTVDDLLRHPDDQPPIGLLLCRKKTTIPI